MKKNNLRSVLIFVGVFFVTYFLMGLALWAYINTTSYSLAKKNIHTYVEKHSRELKKNMFVNVFNNAQKCFELLYATEKTTCENKIARAFATSLKEEEFAGNSGWPNDLYLVKQVGDRFYSLGWSGKIEDISYKTEKARLENRIPRTLQFLTRNCKYFNVYDESPWGCEVYEPVVINENETGYLVRMLVINEEMFLPMTFLYPVAVISSAQYFNLMYTDSRPFLFVLIGNLVIPVIVASLVTWRYRKTKRPTRRKS